MCWFFTVMSNHLHVVVRTRPDVVKTSSVWTAVFGAGDLHENFAVSSKVVSNVVLCYGHDVDR